MHSNLFFSIFSALPPESFWDKDRAALVPLRACLIKHAFAKAMAVNKRNITSQYGVLYLIIVTKTQNDFVHRKHLQFH